MRDLQPYAYVGDTTSLCAECLALVPAKIVIESEDVFYVKQCAVHGVQRALISTDVSYYLRCRAALVPAARPLAYRAEVKKGCPFDCGLCNVHEQHSCMAIVEVVDDCNMRCPTCIAGSFPGAGQIKTLDAIGHMLDAIVTAEGLADIVMISGGEPTIHPKIIDILQLASSKSIDHIMLITNGVRVARDQAFAEALRTIPRLEVYLQFDSLRAEALQDIRGEDVRHIRATALERLNALEIPTTLVCVVKKRVNDDEVNEIISYALRNPCVRGVTFQPIRATGRTEAFDHAENSITLSEVRAEIMRGGLFSDLVPHPCNPESISIGYLLRREGTLTDVTSELFAQTSSNEDRWPTAAADELRTMMYFLPRLDRGDIRYDALFRVTIVSFLDRFNFCTSGVKRSAIHFATPDGALIPLETYYLLYQEPANGRSDSTPETSISLQ